jgi:hypothetical protein
MNFLELVKAVRSRVGMQGTGPSSVTSATSAELDLVNAVSDAWVDIQLFRKDWKWMRDTTNFLLSVGTTTYTISDIFGPNDRHSHWLLGTFYILIDGKKRPLRFVEYDKYVYTHRDDSDSYQPSEFTVRSWDEALIFPSPNNTYTIYADYQKSPQELTSNTDEPELPNQFHRLIMYAAIEKYSVVIVTPELFNQYSVQYATMMGQLMRSQLESKQIYPSGLA